MTDEQMRVAIAEACGWKMYCKEAIDGGWREKECWITAPDGTSQLRRELPDYPNDLNAMHEAESFLFRSNDWSACRHEEELQKITTSWVWYATARQRAEAFLRTAGKFKEDA